MQFTTVNQWHPAFSAPYQGQNSLRSTRETETTNDLTLYAGARLPDGGEIWLNLEIDQGFGLSDTLGIAGFSSGEAYKVGANTPYLRLPRLFYRKAIGLGRDDLVVSAAANQLAGTRPQDNITLTIGKFSVTDLFDANTYAHDPRTDFLNWSIIDAGAFDYAADSWGYTFGVAVEYSKEWWTLRSGVFDLSRVPNGKTLDPKFDQYEFVEELEERHSLAGRPGKVKALLFVNRGRMGSYREAVSLAERTGSATDTALVRRYGRRSGAVLNAEQEVSHGFGLFARLSRNDGRTETYDFTDINRSLSVGAALRGERWERPQDVIGFGVAVNHLSRSAREYFAVGGTGVLIGDGKLAYYAPEKILESYYSIQIHTYLKLTFDYQHVNHPAYNAERGPVNIYGIRLHAEY